MLTRNPNGTFSVTLFNTTRHVIGTVYANGQRAADQSSPVVGVYYVERPEDSYGLGQLRERTLVVERDEWQMAGLEFKS